MYGIFAIIISRLKPISSVSSVKMVVMELTIEWELLDLEGSSKMAARWPTWHISSPNPLVQADASSHRIFLNHS